jgi:hypothetical protein
MRMAHLMSRTTSRPEIALARLPWAAVQGEKEMKLTKGLQNHVENGELSIPAAEEIIEEALNELAYSQDPGLVRALRFLAPPGYQAIVELCSEDGRSKRRSDSADTWSPEEDEVRIYFERIVSDDPAPRLTRVPRAVTNGHSADEEDEDRVEIMPADTDARVKELCAALAEAERGGHAFIALKWFRDSFLPRKAYRWNQNPRDTAVGACRGDSAGHGAHEQDCESQNTCIPHHYHPAQSCGGGYSRGSTALSPH